MLAEKVAKMLLETAEETGGPAPSSLGRTPERNEK